MIKKLNKKQTEKFVCENWEDEDLQEYIIKTCDFFITSDKLILQIDKAENLSIDFSILYNNKQTTLDEFVKYNTSNFTNIFKSLNGGNLHFIATEDATTYLANCNSQDEDAIRKATAEELQELISIYENQKQQYIERLKEYYKEKNKNE